MDRPRTVQDSEFLGCVLSIAPSGFFTAIVVYLKQCKIPSFPTCSCGKEREVLAQNLLKAPNHLSTLTLAGLPYTWLPTSAIPHLHQQRSIHTPQVWNSGAPSLRGLKVVESLSPTIPSPDLRVSQQEDQTWRPARDRRAPYSSCKCLRTCLGVLSSVLGFGDPVTICPLPILNHPINNL